MIVRVVLGILEFFAQLSVDMIKLIGDAGITVRHRTVYCYKPDSKEE